MRSGYRILTSFACLLLILGCSGPLIGQTGKIAYNARLADSLGADDYGMKNYVLVLLKTGPVTIPNQSKVDSLFHGHMKNIQELAARGKLIVAGPLAKNGKGYRGIFIFNVRTLEEARALVATDPAIRARLLDAELYSWYGSAALPLYLPYHSQIERKTFCP